MNPLPFLKKNYLLIIILVIAAILRFVAVKPGYNQYHGDETAIWGSALRMVRNGTLDPGRLDYPATTMYINLLAYKVFFIPVSWIAYYLSNFSKVVDGTLSLVPTPLEANKLFELYIVGERGINVIFWSRYVTALFGLGTVFLTYVLGTKLFGKKVGLLAALFLAFNYKNVMNSHLGLPDIYNAFFSLLAMITAWNLWQKPSRLTYLLAGSAAGISFSVKYQIFAVIPLIFAHFAIVFVRRETAIERLKKLFDPRFITAGLLIPTIFLLTNPYYFIYFERALASNLDDIRKYGFGTNSLNLFPLSYLYHIDYGPLEFILMIFGILTGLFKKTLKSVFLLFVIIPIFYVFIYYTRGGFYVRNFIPVTPLLLIFASYGIWYVADRFGKFKFLAASLIIVPALFVPARNSIISSVSYTQPWDYEILYPWIQKNLPKDVTVGVASFDKSLLGIKNKATNFAQESDFALTEHEENGDSYVVVDLNIASETFYSWMNYGMSEASALWNKPLYILRNTFHGIAAEELFRYQINVTGRSWQAPDMHFVVVKIPEYPKVKMKAVKSFSFDKDVEGWRIVSGNQKTDIELADRSLFDPSSGYNSSGSLVFLPGGIRFSITRSTSPLISVKGGHLYSVSGFMRTEKKLKLNERNGFLRIDFYGKDADLEKLGKDAAVSSRVYGTDDWTEKSILERAPDDAMYLTVSVQSNFGNAGRIWLDNVVIEESSDKTPDITSHAPYTKIPVDLNYLYPNSHGNL